MWKTVPECREGKQICRIIPGTFAGPKVFEGVYRCCGDWSRRKEIESGNSSRNVKKNNSSVTGFRDLSWPESVRMCIIIQS